MTDAPRPTPGRLFVRRESTERSNHTYVSGGKSERGSTCSHQPICILKTKTLHEVKLRSKECCAWIGAQNSQDMASELSSYVDSTCM